MQNFNIKDTFRILKNGKISMVLAAMLSSMSVTSSVIPSSSLALVATLSLITASNSFAAPQGGTVTAGTATINQSGATTNINQSSNKAVINWNTFSVGKNETVNFNQPSVNSVTLNRVIGNEKSVIDGMLNANGQVFLVNPNGILISKSGSINTAGF